MKIVRSDARRVTTTLNATMTTLASPTLGGASVSLWQVEMNPGAAGPMHAFEDEVVWAVTAGDGTLRTDDDIPVPLHAGVTLVIEGGRMRRFTAGDAGFTAVVTAVPSAVTAAGQASATVPPWVA